MKYKGFYGGEIVCMQGLMKQENMDFILDIIDRYIELREVIKNDT